MLAYNPEPTTTKSSNHVTTEPAITTTETANTGSSTTKSVTGTTEFDTMESSTVSTETGIYVHYSIDKISTLYNKVSVKLQLFIIL